MNSIKQGQSKDNLSSMFQNFRSNPMQFLLQQKLNIPQELGNNPQGIIQHLLDTGQMTQKQLNELQSFAQKLH